MPPTERDREQALANAAQRAIVRYGTSWGNKIHRDAWEYLRAAHQANADALASVPLVLSPGLLVSGMDHATPYAEIIALMNQAAITGTTWVRSDFWWYSVEPIADQWSWDYFDSVVDAVTSRGMQVIPILQGTPAWASADGQLGGVPNVPTWEAFIRATVVRYRDRVRVWEVWNEPDRLASWRGTPAQYAMILDHAYRTIKSIDPVATVWLGGLAQGGSSYVGDFLPQIVGAGVLFDAVNVHTNFRSMSDVTAQLAAAQVLVPGKPLVVTEASYTSDPGWQSIPGYQDGETGQARYLTDVYRAMQMAGVTVAVWANIGDYQADDPYAGSGLFRLDGSPKPAMAAFQALS